MNDFIGLHEEDKEESGGADPFSLAMVAAEDDDHNMIDEQAEDPDSRPPHEFGYDAFNPIEDGTLDSVNTGREMMDPEGADLDDLINLFHGGSSLGQSGLSTKRRSSVMPSVGPSSELSRQQFGRESHYRNWVNQARDMSALPSMSISRMSKQNI